jgi:tetratricopeptide (TPR) repeat protein
LAFASGLVAALASVAPASPANAQRTIRPSDYPDAKRLLVVTFRPGGATGTSVAEALRDNMYRVIPRKEVWAIPTEEVKNNQEPSGFPYDVPLTTKDAALLSNRLRADEFIEGTVVQEGGQLTAQARMVLADDPRLVQPLPPAVGRRADHLARSVSEHFRDARKQLSAVRRCLTAVNRNQYQEGATAAKEAIAAYPTSTLGRICLGSAYSYMGMPADSILPLVEQILASDPNSHHALTLAYTTYKKAGDTKKSVEYIGRLLLLEPNNVQLATQVIEEIAATGEFEIARRLIDEAVGKNPGDPDLIRLRFRILVVTKDWKESIKAGEELLRTDTSATDTTFFRNLASAYKEDSQPQRAAETIARAIAKYPNLPSLWTVYSQFLRDAGQTAESIAAARKAIALDPKNPGTTIAYLTIANTFNEQNQPDSVESVLRAAAAGAPTQEDSARVGQFAQVVGNRFLQVARADSLPERSLEARQQFEKAIVWFALSDSIAPSPQTKFNQGFAAFNIVAKIGAEIQAKPKELGAAGTCDLARLGQTNATMAQLMITRGGSVNPAAAAQIMQGVLQMLPYFESLVKTHCK